MAVLLNRAYLGRLSGVVASFGVSTETALVGSGLATASVDASLTTGAYTQNTAQGKAAIAAGASSVVITNSLVDANTKVWAMVAQAAADGTLLRVERVLAASGSFTIFGTANATATTLIDWAIIDDEPGTSGT
ncbi:MAG: hypothetical protein WC901_01055 [Candidatus Margulisiibacteriota bacterium]